MKCKEAKNRQLKWYFFTFSLLMPLLCFAQVNISGKIVDKADGRPIPGATVFLNNATKGTITNNEGFFTLLNVKKGQYDLVITCIGYETYYQKVIAGDSQISLSVIKLTVKATALHEVKIGAKSNSKYLKMFIEEFLGKSANARWCKVLNQDIISADFDDKANTLTANTDGYLMIENKATGYKIYYQVDNFSKNYNSNLLHYEGPVRFEELEGNLSDVKRWAKNRASIYKGSSMNFLRSVFQSNFSQQGFMVLRLIRLHNADHPSDSLFRTKIRTYSVNAQEHPDWQDSLRLYRSKMKLPKFFEVLLNKPLAEKDFAQPTESKEFMQLQFRDYLCVVYTNTANKWAIDHLQTTFREIGTVITLSNQQALFDSNGIFTNPSDIIFDGTWGLSGVADMLPVDYKP